MVEEWAYDIPKIPWIRTNVSLNETILDVGAADGMVWEDTPLKVVRLDKSPEFNPDIIGEAENLPFEENTFGIVCICELLEHVEEPKRVLQEAARVAKLKVILTVPWEHAWTKDQKPFLHPGHLRFYTPVSLKTELEGIGLPFQIVPIIYSSKTSRLAWVGAEIYSCAKC